MKKPDGIRAIAVFEAVKGIIVPIVVFRLLPYLSNHTQQVAEALVLKLRLNPANEVPANFIRQFGEFQSTKMWLITLLVLGYAALRFTEAYGLWFHRRWAEWLAVVSAGLYLPIEVLELTRRFNVWVFSIFIINLMIVLYLSRVLWKKSDNA
ncbi:MAG: DUF2127 domain-containing protein [Verrucomicrobiota bacterium]